MDRCSWYERRLRALVDGELDEREARRVREHLERCLACRAAHARVHSVTALLHEAELEDAPAHFAAGLQVRLARHRRGKARGLPGLRLRLASWTLPRGARLAGGLAVAAAAAGVLIGILASPLRAAEIARRAELSWSQIRNYGCEFESRGVYQGQERTFVQRQFFRRPDEFRLETSQDYPLVTFVRRDRVVHYLPRGDWKGRGPLVIVRPRRPGEEALPFPFGVTWRTGGNVSLDQLIRQLNSNNDAELMGTEPVEGRDCYRIRFSAVPPGGRQLDDYELWVDRESFLPRRVSWYRDEENHIVTEAKFLQVNSALFPAQTFQFTPPDGACVVHGDVDPHVLALPQLPSRPDRFDVRPVSAAREEAWGRADSVPFPVLAPEWLPDGYKLVRVRRKVGRWLDIHWIRERAPGVNDVVKLVEREPGTEDAMIPDARPVRVGSGRHARRGWMVTASEPYPYVTLTWDRGRTRCELFAADLSPDEVLRIAESVTRVTDPAPVVTARAVRRPEVEVRGEPSVIPSEGEPTLADERSGPAPPEPSAPSAPSPPPATAAAEQPPMMPETADEDRGRAQVSAPTR